MWPTLPLNIIIINIVIIIIIIIIIKKQTHVIYETWVYFYMTEHDPDPADFVAKGLLSLMTSRSVATGLTHSKLII